MAWPVKNRLPRTNRTTTRKMCCNLLARIAVRSSTLWLYSHHYLPVPSISGRPCSSGQTKMPRPVRVLQDFGVFFKGSFQGSLMGSRSAQRSQIRAGALTLGLNHARFLRRETRRERITPPKVPMCEEAQALLYFCARSWVALLD